MERASLRIKFSPLIQHKNDSKCCLEIVPEVSCIKNLENIDWHEKSDFIEYAIPMTYKLIIRKRQSVQESYHNLDKVYHSCVDLLTNSSSTCISLGRGDNTAKIVSDTLIYDTYKTTLDNEIFITKNSNSETMINSNEDIKDNLSDCNIHILDKLLDQLSSDCISVDVASITKVDAITSQFFTRNDDIADNGFSDKIVWNNKTKLCKETLIDCKTIEASTSRNRLNSLQNLIVTSDFKETVKEVSVSSNKLDSLRKLSVTSGYDKTVTEVSTSNNKVDSLQKLNITSGYDETVTEISTSNNKVDSIQKLNITSGYEELVKDISTPINYVDSLQKLSFSLGFGKTFISRPSNKVDSLRTLSITPIYSINTVDNVIDQNVPMLSPHLTSNIFSESQIFTEIAAIQDVLLLRGNNDDNVTNRRFSTSADYCPIKRKSFCTRERELPEVRVANFIKKMETEIMPLKIILHDILQKCSTMGLTMNESLRLKEYSIDNKQQTRYCTFEKQPKCNRVVYSFVLDG